MILKPNPSLEISRIRQFGCFTNLSCRSIKLTALMVALLLFAMTSMDRWKELGDGRTLLRSLDPTYAREKLSNVYDQTKC